MEDLSTYLRNIDLANRYRMKAEYFEFDAKPEIRKKWGRNLIEVWGKNLLECGNSIKKIIESKE